VRELCGKVGVNSTTLCLPLPHRLHVAPLERGRWNPRKGYDHLTRARPGRCRDIRPAERVSSVTSNLVRPSPPLCRHPRHYSIIPGTVGAQDDGTLPRSPLCSLRSSVSPTLRSLYGRRPNEKLPRRYPRSRSWTGTELTTTPARSKIRQDSRRLHDTVHHATICSA
jgi:hypothetical protein